MMQSGKPLIVSRPDEVPGHSMYADWALPGRKYSYIALDELARKLGHGRSPQTVEHSQICAKPGDWFGSNDFAGSRFEAADQRYPGILVADMPNPCNLPYRMIDGRRRLEKLQRLGISHSPFFVFEYAEILPFVFDFELGDRAAFARK